MDILDVVGAIVAGSRDRRTVPQICDDARAAVGLPPIDREYYFRTKSLPDHDACPAAATCSFYLRCIEPYKQET